ncbi:unnamed protein product [Psylliodes chrysocephalus]|uniref:Lipase n=1 Tax=Psylliodes chrysocephalus TaxID=3402493 RepID=A0A9P0GEV8_9CUCU|nr:unnamed protein product [Psylliodes chrysocephala]
MNFVFTFLVTCSLPLGTLLQEEGSNLDFVKAVSNNKYPIEIHEVETEDGYILTVFRIPQGKNSNKISRNVVLLNHGMFGSSENYILLGPKKSLGYVLADNGYDVWIMNSRGTWHSKKHRTLSPKQKEFWQFSWHEIGVYDIPAVIDHILNITNETRINYIGHSQGCTSAFVMGSERPEYNDKIKLMIALSPAAFYKHMKHDMLKMASNYGKQLEDLANSLGIYELPPPFMSAAQLREIIRLLCIESSVLQNTCNTLFFLIGESNPSLQDKNSIKQILPLIVASVSIKQVFHYSQQISSGNFQQYDFGQEKNLEKYGSKYPPLYNIKNITFPVVIFYSSGDRLVSEEDTLLLASQLPNLVGAFQVPAGFSHVDFIIANNLDKIILRPVLKLLKRYNLHQ